jgi:hypothetical protein
MTKEQFKHNLQKTKRIKNFNAKTNNKETLSQMFNAFKDIYQNDLLTELNKVK